MSCEQNRGVHFSAVAGEPALQQALGTTDTATTRTALDNLFAQGRRTAPATITPAARSNSQRDTRAMFAEINARRIAPPTHSKTGLPKPESVYGYALVQQTIVAARKGEPLPAPAAALATINHAGATTRHLEHIRTDAVLQQQRCGSCGRFAPASGTGTHVCPNTATPAKFGRALQRRLGTPASAYPLKDLTDLLADAKNDGGITLRHGITGEYVKTDPDGMVLAMVQGFVPDRWQDRAVLVEAGARRCAPVIDPTGLAQIAAPTSRSASAVASAAVASGAAIPASTPMVPLIAPTLSTPMGVLAGGTPFLMGGTSYNAGRFIGTEFLKHAGTSVLAPGDSTPLVVGDSYAKGWAKSLVRHTEGGKMLTPSIKVPRTLYQALQYHAPAHDGEQSFLRPHTYYIDADRYELVDTDGSLLAVVDGKSRTVGSADGAENASAVQSAALMGYFASRAKITTSTPTQDGFCTEFDTYRAATYDTGAPHPLSIADGAYLTIAEDIKEHGPIMMGATLHASTCPTCGRFVGSQIHVCRFAPASLAAPEPIAAVPEPIAVVTPSQDAVQDRLVRVLDGLVARLETLDKAPSSPREMTMPFAGAPVAASPPVRQPTGTRTTKDRPVPAAPRTETEQIVTAKLRMPKYDSTLSALDSSLLGTDFAPLPENIPSPRDDYTLNAPARMVLTRMTNQLHAGQKIGRVNTSRAFGIYGPPGTGKNTLVEQFAATVITVDADGNERQGMPYFQVEFTKDMDPADLIGTTGLTNGSTYLQLGPVAQAAAQGAVICMNEVVRNPKALTAFQSMLEEGTIRIATPEGGTTEIPVHPSTVFVLTWNPGLEGDSDRPANAPLDRIVSYELPRPTMQEMATRAQAHFAKAPPEYAPSRGEINAATALFNDMYEAIVTKGQIQGRSGSGKALPGPRQLTQFLLAGKTDGWMTALEGLRIYGDQREPDKTDDFTVIQGLFTTRFGADGNALSRTAPTRI